MSKNNPIADGDAVDLSKVTIITYIVVNNKIRKIYWGKDGIAILNTECQPEDCPDYLVVQGWKNAQENRRLNKEREEKILLPFLNNHILLKALVDELLSIISGRGIEPEYENLENYLRFIRKELIPDTE